LLITDHRESPAWAAWEEVDSFPGALLWAVFPGKSSVLAVNRDSTWRVRDVARKKTFSGRFNVPVREGALAAISPDGQQTAVYYQECIAIASIQGGQRVVRLPMVAKAMRFDADGALRIVGFSTRLSDRPAGTVSVGQIESGAQHPAFSDPLDSKVQLTDSSAITTAVGFLIAGRTDSGGGRLEMWNYGVDARSRSFNAPVHLHGKSADDAWSLLSCPSSSVCHVVDVASAQLSSKWKYPLKSALASAAIRANGKHVAFGFAGGDIEIVRTVT
jgi:hypothetical protein